MAFLAALGVGGLLWLGAHSAHAQDTASPPATANEAQEALERAQRLADNPMRHILRASRIQRRAPEAEAQTPASTVAEPVVRVLAVPWADGAAPSAQATALDPQALVQTLRLPAAQDWPSLPRLPEQDPLVPEPEVPQLQAMVEPTLDLRLRDQLGRLEPVDAILTLRMDGSVAAVNFPGSVDTRLRRVVQRALEQWRYAPLRTAQDHRVQLVFPDER